MNRWVGIRIAQAALVIACPALCLLLFPGPSQADDNDVSIAPAVHPNAEQRARFQEAWQSAARGPRDQFEALGPELQDYVLYPYWQYEDYRHRRADVAPDTMAAFLDAHESWAFTPGLRTAWLRTLGKQRQWDALAEYGEGARNTEVRCYHARARLATGDTEGLLAEA